MPRTETEPMTSTDARSPAAGQPTAAHAEAAGAVPVAEPTAPELVGPEQVGTDQAGAEATVDQLVAAPPPRQPDLDSRLAALEAAVEAGLAAVHDRLADATARAAARERVIDRQHAEIERLRSAERSGLLRPVITDLYRLRNDLLRQAATTPDTISAEQVRGLLRSYADEVRDTLERCGVAVLSAPPGTRFEPGRHHVTAVRSTTEPGRDGTVAELVGDGYLDTDTGKVVAPARVTLFRCAGIDTTLRPGTTLAPDGRGRPDG